MLAVETLCICKGVLVEPSSLIVPVDGTIDTLSGRRALITGISLSAVEFLSSALVDRITSGNLEFEVINNLPCKSGIGIKIVYNSLPILITDCLRRIESVVI